MALSPIPEKGISQRKINRKTGINRRTIRRYGRLYDQVVCEDTAHSNYPTSEGMATGSWEQCGQNTPPRPPGLPKHARSACEPHREWIEKQLGLGRNAMSICQDLVELFGFTHRYNAERRAPSGW